MERRLSGSATNDQFCLLPNVGGGDAGTPIHDHDHECNIETACKRKSQMTVVIDGTSHRPAVGQTSISNAACPTRYVSRHTARYILIGTPAMCDRSSRKLAGSARGVKQ
ncbi:hypothetical protein LAC81_10155 [Ensifer adhaerens]|uniref:hypothetical protein n=1 Tax=Ensifer adhaerens TaxID=106592 RepID=UPI001CBE9156|nr:hypothetical protein [Ensifer adhaerens]MBZ7922149.1 hypothetical protein [Ensifer adhaerens]UAX94531.1 hypothetical protein LAC78_10150 [Ensifer adhaerens]UAY02166.1 hypothetical protein LAC80_10160 [Ensifer adhaerens]UAY09549.1 hypothetical protein LAC81_10155 [Ensifer adhaerens]